MNGTAPPPRPASRTTSIRRCLLGAFVLLCSCSPPAARDRGDTPVRGDQVVPLATVEADGHRYVARADLGIGRDVPLMVHGNAGMYLQVTHGVGERINGGPVRKAKDYGYSSKGMGVIDVPLLRLGARRFSNLRDVPVFDFTEDVDTTIQGMLGVAFLTAERAAVDFSRDVLILGVDLSVDPNRRLVEGGYRYAPMTLGARQRPTITVRFPAIDRALPVTPSTVANALTLHRTLFADAVPMRRRASPDRSPSGTSPDLFVSDSIAFEVAGVRFRSPASFEDFAATEPELAIHRSD